MFDIGFLELSIILVLSLLVLGPERLPKAARTIGYWFGKARRYVEGMKSQVEAEFDSTEVKRLLHNQEVQIRELQSKLTSTEDLEVGSQQNKIFDIDDPGTGHVDESPVTVNKQSDLTQDEVKEEKPAAPLYDMIEEGDDRWDEWQQSNVSSKQDEVNKPVQAEAEQGSNDDQDNQSTAK